MHFSEDLGFGVVDANVAVNLARAWTEHSTSANQASTTRQTAQRSRSLRARQSVPPLRLPPIFASSRWR